MYYTDWIYNYFANSYLDLDNIILVFCLLSPELEIPDDCSNKAFKLYYLFSSQSHKVEFSLLVQNHIFI